MADLTACERCNSKDVVCDSFWGYRAGLCRKCYNECYRQLETIQTSQSYDIVCRQLDGAISIGDYFKIEELVGRKRALSVQLRRWFEDDFIQ